jgi:hypothetical protein
LEEIPSMKSLCVGFVRARDRAHGWAPCGRARREGDKLCNAHRDALDGAVFGLFQSIEPSDGKKAKRQAALRAANRRKVIAERATLREPGAGKRSGAAERRPQETGERAKAAE